MFKKFLFFFVFVFLFFPIVTLAAEDKTTLRPEFNPLCWKLKDCQTQRCALTDTSVSGGCTPEKIDSMGTNGWIVEEPCLGTTGEEKWGKCLPASVATTQIYFGGKNKFANIGEFIKSNYNMAISVAGILAVIMIVVAGVQWATSGGNSEMISSAKNRIGGALVGLLIAYLSYSILNIVNPNLVNLRLPQTWMIRPFKTGTQWCRDLDNPTSTAFALAYTKDKVFSSAAIADAAKKAQFNIEPKEMPNQSMPCGDHFFASGSGVQTCMGDFCAKDEGVCLPITMGAYNVAIPSPSCAKYDLVVHYTINPSFIGVLKNQSWWTSALESDWLDNDNVNFWSVCKNGNGEIRVFSIGNKPTVSLSAPIDGAGYKEYYMTVSQLVKNPDGSPKDSGSLGCGDSEVVGIILGNDLKVAKSVWDTNFFSSSKEIGGWKSVSQNGYLPIKELLNGMYLESSLSDVTARDVIDKSNSVPGPGLDGKPYSNQEIYDRYDNGVGVPAGAKGVY